MSNLANASDLRDELAALVAILLAAKAQTLRPNGHAQFWQGVEAGLLVGLVLTVVLVLAM